MIYSMDFMDVVDDRFYLTNKEEIQMDCRNEHATFRFQEGVFFEVETIHQKIHESWTKKFDTPLYLLRGKGSGGRVWYHLYTPIQSDFVVLMNLFFHPSQDTYLSVDFNRFTNGSSIRLTDCEIAKWKSLILAMKDEAVHSIVAKDSPCRLYFTTQDVDVTCYF